jgi:4-hydroxybenzoate polyprenyltransferase
VKNLFVLAPLVFGRRVAELDALVPVLAALVSFCLASGAVYVFNDLADLRSDAAHPTRSRRPLASGSVTAKAAWALISACAVASLALAASIRWEVAVIVAAYLALNAGYTRTFKHVPFLDVACIAAGFLLRVLAGRAASGVTLSHWLVVCTFLLSLFLGLGKRKHEILVAGADGHLSRRVLALYRIQHLDLTLYATAMVTAVAYALYAVSAETILGHHPRALVWTVPFMLFGLVRFVQLVMDSARPESPTEAMVTDVPFLVNMGLWTACVFYIIYL